MRRIIINRVLLAIPMLWVVATFMFVLLQLVPGDSAVAILGEGATPERVAALRGQMGLNDPVLTQYLNWMGSLLTGDFGKSTMSGESVLSILNKRAPVTLSLAITAVLVSFAVGTVLGVVAAVFGGWLDRVIRIVTGVGVAVPNFWLGSALVVVVSVGLGWLPSVGYVPFAKSPGEWLYFMILPITAIAAASVAAIARQARAAMQGALQSEYVQTLRGAGLPRRSIIFKHALRNTSIPVVTIVGWQFVSLLGGAVLVERVFALPGLGALTVQATASSDFPVLQGMVIYTTAMVLIVNLLVDLSYLWLSPKVRDQ
ncbi:ABC transporter permease [Pseudarthrobacter raffinosi]|uniref:ABC transporter permease n=1 Tax=Pseudarthrobacter raffinosi TaxID=2953651 RepID=UPI00208F7A76|nr:ABC transporter permease [Pseudarthrobacter sp. MDT3-9]MCO4252136.1 ABC transporter permease [Pseudarthrobacter sp. MDT3-9]